MVTTIDPALTTLVRYFDALDRFDLDTLRGCFSEDVEYFHPPYSASFPELGEIEGGNDWKLAKGRDELIRLFEFRGKQDTNHIVTAFTRSGSLCFYEGYGVDGAGRPRAKMVAIFLVDTENRISRYSPFAGNFQAPTLGSDCYTYDSATGRAVAG